MNKLGSIVFGIILVIVGVILGLNWFGITDINLFFNGWWTLIIIIPSIINIIAGKHKTDGIIGLVVGIILLLICQKIVNFEDVVKLAIPIVIVAIGLDILIKNIFNKKDNK